MKTSAFDSKNHAQRHCVEQLTCGERRSRSKRYRICLFFSMVLCLALPPGIFATSETKIELSKFKIVLNGERMVWKNASEMPVSEQGRGIIEFIFTHTWLKPGISLTKERLEKEVYRFQTRLEKTSLYYSVRVNIIPPRRYPERRTILMTIEDGFTDRFGGGSIFAAWYALNINGKGTEAGIVAGLNKVSCGYKEKALFGSPAFAGGNIGYSNTGIVDAGSLSHILTGSLQTGYSIHPDFNVFTGVDSYIVWLPNGDEKFPWQGGRYNQYLLPNAGCKWKYVQGTDNAQQPFANVLFTAGYIIEANGTLLYQFDVIAKTGATFGIFQINMTTYGRYVPAGLPGLFKTDLYSGIERHVRSGYSADTLSSDAYAGSSLELEVTGYTFSGISLCDISFNPFLFTDQAFSSHGTRYKPLEKPEYLNAYGGGLKIQFAAPVFLGLEISAGINTDMKQRIYFAAGTE